MGNFSEIAPNHFIQRCCWCTAGKLSVETRQEKILMSQRNCLTNL